jgi:hypothetical protein
LGTLDLALAPEEGCGVSVVGLGEVANGLGGEVVEDDMDLPIGRLRGDQRCYGASGEDKASSSLATTDEVPHAAAE